jgi:hypothetical protein
LSLVGQGRSRRACHGRRRDGVATEPCAAGHARCTGIAAWLAAAGAALAQPVVVETPALVYQGRGAGPLVVETPTLVYQGRGAGPVVVHTPALVYQGRGSAPVVVETPALVYQGRGSGPVVVDTPALIYQGRVSGPVVVETPALVYQGRGSGPVVVDTPALVYRGGVSEPATPPAPAPGLQYVDVPTEARASRYLRLASAGVDLSQPLRLRYEGLPEAPGYGALFYVGAAAPRHVAWFYTSRSRPAGEYQRGGNSLPPLTGPWKACIGFPPRVTSNDPDLTKYEDCVDFVLAGPGSLGARPTLVLPPAPLRAGRDLPIDYAAMPPCNCRIALHDAAGRLVASHQTGRLATGRWTTRVDAPGRYELRITYLGDAVRAHMTLDVVP